jgi:hypothetical protein
VQFGYICRETNVGKQVGDFAAEPPGRTVSLIDRTAENVSDFFLHAAAVAFSASLQPGLYRILNVPND